MRRWKSTQCVFLERGRRCDLRGQTVGRGREQPESTISRSKIQAEGCHAGKDGERRGKGGQSSGISAGIIPNPRGGGGAPVDGSLERQQVAGVGKMSGNTMSAPWVIGSGRGLRERREGFKGTGDPEGVCPTWRQNWGCHKTIIDRDEFYAETTRTVELVNEIRDGEYG